MLLPSNRARKYHYNKRMNIKGRGRVVTTALFLCFNCHMENMCFTVLYVMETIRLVFLEVTFKGNLLLITTHMIADYFHTVDIFVYFVL